MGSVWVGSSWFSLVIGVQLFESVLVVSAELVGELYTLVICELQNTMTSQTNSIS